MKRNVSTTAGIMIILTVAAVAMATVLSTSSGVTKSFLRGEEARKSFFERTVKKSEGKTITIKIPLIIATPTEEDFTEARERGAYVGCGDVVYYISKEIDHTLAPLNAVYQELFSLQEVLVVDEVEYVNPIYYHVKGRAISTGSGDDWIVAPLEFEKVTVENGIASVYLMGGYATVGTCEPPRTQAVLEFSATQFDTVDSVNIYLNGDKMEFIHGGE